MELLHTHTYTPLQGAKPHHKCHSGRLYLSKRHANQRSPDGPGCRAAALQEAWRARHALYASPTSSCDVTKFPERKTGVQSPKLPRTSIVHPLLPKAAWKSGKHGRSAWSGKLKSLATAYVTQTMILVHLIVRVKHLDITSFWKFWNLFTPG